MPDENDADDATVASTESVFRIDSDPADVTDIYTEHRGGHDPSSRDTDSADDVDAEKLFGQVTLDQIRYYTDNTWAGTLVDKPIDDAFKNGWSVETSANSNVLEATLNYNDPNGIITADGSFEEDYRFTQKKARRDGFALLFAVTRDEAEINESPKNVQEITRFRTLTVDDFTDTPPTDFDERLPADHEREDVVITDSGLVISANIESPDFGSLLGVLWDRDLEIETDTPTEDDLQSRTAEGANKFIHRDRFFHYVWRPEVDGPVDEDTVGEYEGDSVLQRSIHTIRTILKINWAGGQALFRNSAPLHTLEPPRGISEDNWEKADAEMSNINAKSSFTLPPPPNDSDDGWELDAVDATGVADPEPWYDALFNQVCAGQEMNKSVFFGTQTGTVSGSETDIKNYYSAVERIQNNRIEDDFRRFLKRLNSWSDALAPNFELGDFAMEFEPLFKLDKLKRMEAANRTVQAVTSGTTNYILSIEEARSILDEKWAELGVDADIDGVLTEAERDDLDRANTSYGKQYQTGTAPENEVEQSPMASQNGGGRDGRSSSTPTTDS